MLRIRRTKRSVKDGQPGPEATHYAAAVEPRGAVERWSADPAQAVAVTEAVAKRVGEFYRGRPGVGTLAVEKVSATAAQLAQAVAADDAVGAAEFAALQLAHRGLMDEHA